MGKAKYYAASARHQFGKAAYGKDGTPAFVGAALLTAALGGGGIWMVADERPDNLTTPQTETVLAELQGDLATLQQDFTELRAIEARLQSGDYTTAEFNSLQNERLSAERAFTQKAEPVLDRILFTPHLSERQAQTLMRDFAQNVKDPVDIARRYDIKDYGFLRDKREEVIAGTRNSSVSDIVKMTQQEVDHRNENKWFGFSFGMIPVLFLALVLGCCAGDSRTLKRWAQNRPQKPQKPKH
ncbi:MAG: hypothetical protein EA357_11510 [Micavibrio sp.]|nr:MAG: hypothetical protein EA357_11510 [Micavibrio sp.]